jgi:hypothetical protein
MHRHGEVRASPSEAPDRRQEREEAMRQRTATIQSPHPDTSKSPTSDGAANNAHAWLLRRLRWEHRVAELRTEHEHGSRT